MGYTESGSRKPPSPGAAAYLPNGAGKGGRERGKKKVEIEIKIDANCAQPRVVIVTDRVTPQIESLVARLQQTEPRLLVGTQQGVARVLEAADILRIRTVEGKIYASTRQGEHQLRLRLYELEQQLDQSSFVRISQGEIVNLKEVRGFDLNLAGSVRVTLSDGSVTYVSRRYIPRIRKLLGL